ncbi:hypothetical protein ABID29_002190 [Streptococcus rupicaprae]|uniref:Phage protein n=1 Tax=Streptococcus rupicaprae TaxID=759619 RepID=A0ABV2FKH7_9STRE
MKSTTKMSILAFILVTGLRSALREDWLWVAVSGLTLLVYLLEQGLGVKK